MGSLQKILDQVGGSPRDLEGLLLAAKGISRKVLSAAYLDGAQEWFPQSLSELCSSLCGITERQSDGA